MAGRRSGIGLLLILFHVLLGFAVAQFNEDVKIGEQGIKIFFGGQKIVPILYIWHNIDHQAIKTGNSSIHRTVPRRALATYVLNLHCVTNNS